MSSNEAFFHGLLRVSMLQLLSARGFDRALPTTVDTFTDLYVKYMELITHELKEVMQARGDRYGLECVSLQDLTLTLQNLGVTKPVDLLDLYGQRNPEDNYDVGMEKFKSWCLGEQNKSLRQVVTPSVDFLTAEGDGYKSSKPLSAIPEYINQLQQQKEHTPSTVKLGSIQPTLPPLQQQQDEHIHELIEELINNGETDDWIRMVLARQRIELGRKHSNMSGVLENLPNIPSLKTSSLRELASTRDEGKNELLPTPCNMATEKTKENEKAIVDENPKHMKFLEKQEKLLKYLPIKRPEDRFENIVLSFEESSESLEPDDMAHEDLHSDSASPTNAEHNFNQGVPEMGPMHLQKYPDMQDDLGTPMDYQLDNPDAIFDEQEDMDNTFQRRASLDFGNDFN